MQKKYFCNMLVLVAFFVQLCIAKNSSESTIDQDISKYHHQHPEKFKQVVGILKDALTTTQDIIREHTRKAELQEFVKSLKNSTFLESPDYAQPATTLAIISFLEDYMVGRITMADFHEAHIYINRLISQALP